jgi:hypothetical protein
VQVTCSCHRPPGLASAGARGMRSWRSMVLARAPCSRTCARAGSNSRRQDSVSYICSYKPLLSAHVKKPVLMLQPLKDCAHTTSTYLLLSILVDILHEARWPAGYHPVQQDNSSHYQHVVVQATHWLMAEPWVDLPSPGVSSSTPGHAGAHSGPQQRHPLPAAGGTNKEQQQGTGE